jgi:hypothetical protein
MDDYKLYNKNGFKYYPSNWHKTNKLIRYLRLSKQ